jgi:cell division protein FtsQ
MFDFLRNLRLPGRRSNAYRRGVQRRVRREPVAPRRFALGRAARPEPRREIHIPWRRVGVACASVAAVAGVVYGAAWLVTGDTFRVLEIEVAGAQVETPHVVARAAGIGQESMLTVDLTTAKERVLALPAVKSVEVTRQWPRRVQIHVVEHQAWGYWQVANQRLVVDSTGRVLEASRPAPRGAATIIEIGAPREGAQGDDPDTVRLVARLQGDRVFARLGVEPAGFVFRRDRGLTIVVPGHPDITFGDSSNYDFKVRTLRALEDRVGSDGLEASEIDLRFGRNVVLR